MRIVFSGTPHFADCALKALLASDAAHSFQVVAVFTQPDRPAGRGMKLTPSPVKKTALSYGAQGIPVYQPRSLKLDGQYPDDAQAAKTVLETLAPDVMIVAAYGLILPQWALDLPKAGCINIHASLLPRWRGAAPIQRAIQAGDTESGVGLMRMALGLDTGDIYAQSPLPITPCMTGGQLHDALAQLGASLLCQHLGAIVAGVLPAAPQAAIGINYAHKLLREHGVLDWRLDATTLANQVRAFDPTPGCSFEQLDAQGHLHTYKVWAAHALATSAHTLGKNVGEVVAVGQAGVDIVCGDNTLLRMTEIQKPGGKRLFVSACWQGLGF
jgi:methionyl-tRNA formyltransferase